jgi:hypothetical protein
MTERVSHFVWCIVLADVYSTCALAHPPPTLQVGTVSGRYDTNVPASPLQLLGDVAVAS